LGKPSGGTEVTSSSKEKKAQAGLKKRVAKVCPVACQKRVGQEMGREFGNRELQEGAEAKLGLKRTYSE